MIGIGKSIAHTAASISYGWNEEKEAEVVFKQHLIGERPNEIAQEFKIIQEQNCRCTNNTLSFVLSPTIEDGKSLNTENLSQITAQFIKAMQLENNQAIAFVHRDKEHTHIHLYVNRIDFNGNAFKDNFIGKRSQLAAESVAKRMGFTTAREIQEQKLLEIKTIRNEIKKIHEKVLEQGQPQNFDSYIKFMEAKEVKVIPVINKSEQLQGFRFQYKGHNLKGSEVHRSMSGGKLTLAIANNKNKSKSMDITKEGMIALKLMGKATLLSPNIAQLAAKKIAKKVLQKTIQKVLDVGIGF